MAVNARGCKRLVVKVGTSTLTHESGQLNLRRTQQLIRVLADLNNKGLELLLVSSGAIAVGMGKLGISPRPRDLPTLQACAATGQLELMYFYDRYFSEFNRTIAQVLLTQEDLGNAEQRGHLSNTLNRLLECGVLPILNENDSVSVDEILHGDNDNLSAQVAKLVNADALVLLSDIDGFYEADPRQNAEAKLLERVSIDSVETYAAVSGSGTNRGTGGMRTKLEAARLSVPAGVRTFLLNGRNPEILYDLVESDALGSEFVE